MYNSLFCSVTQTSLFSAAHARRPPERAESYPFTFQPCAVTSDVTFLVSFRTPATLNAFEFCVSAHNSHADARLCRASRPSLLLLILVLQTRVWHDARVQASHSCMHSPPAKTFALRPNPVKCV